MHSYLIFCETEKYDCVMKTIEVLSFLSGIYHSVTAGSIFLLLSITSVNNDYKHNQDLTFLCLVGYHRYFDKHFFLLEHSIKILNV